MTGDGSLTGGVAGASQMRGKRMFVVLFATLKCPPCREAVEGRSAGRSRALARSPSSPTRAAVYEEVAEAMLDYVDFGG